MKVVKKIVKIISSNKIKLIISLFVFSQFMFFGWALGKFVEPNILPVEIDKFYDLISNATSSQLKKGTLEIGANMSFYPTSTGGLIKFNNNGNFYIKSGGDNGITFYMNNTRMDLFYDASTKSLKLKSNVPIYLNGGITIRKNDGSMVDSIHYPEYGSLCGYSRRMAESGVLKCKNLIKCNGRYLIGNGYQAMIDPCNENINDILVNCPEEYEGVKINDGWGNFIATCYYKRF